jgi:hypothetical protein
LQKVGEGFAGQGIGAGHWGWGEGGETAEVNDCTLGTDGEDAHVR